MSFDDNDFPYKVSFQRILWKMGFWSRIEIPVLAYSIDDYTKSLKRHDLTDVDVYGELINSDFATYKYIADCKSGRNVKATERAYWLKGVMEFTGATKGFLIKKKISSNTRLFLDKLSIYAIDEKNLSELEKIYYVSNNNDLFSVDYYKKRYQIIDELKDEYAKIYSYLSGRYWYNPLHSNLRILLNMLQKNNFYQQFNQESSTSHKFIILEIAICLSRIVLDCCNYVLHRNISDIPSCVLEYSFGGIAGYNNKRNMFNEIKALLETEMPNEEMNKLLIMQSDFIDGLIKLVANFITESHHSKESIKYLELMQHEIILDKELNFQDLIGPTFSSVGLKLAKDVLRYYIGYANINESIILNCLKK
ncbi:hypothetical protein H1S01_19095 [Heliobacterium chlorum]|uniref:Restriction endonuclease n=1 Tax=Heliobacterium chlorum TaxID=2698 RepID=A0ABR7T987_HELCL|nr:hypothetical protein [Heliobacterium chlorum]MBC9786564.1 hypothetical protein [Heliobacterium chlorum]